MLMALSILLWSASVAAEAQFPEKIAVAACYRPARVISGVKERAPKESFEEGTRVLTEKFLSKLASGLKEKGVSVDMKDCPPAGTPAIDESYALEIVFDFLVFPYAWGPEKVAVGGTVRVGPDRFPLFQKGEKLPWLHLEDFQGVATAVEEIVSKKVAQPVPKVVAVSN